MSEQADDKRARSAARACAKAALQHAHIPRGTMYFAALIEAEYEDVMGAAREMLAAHSAEAEFEGGPEPALRRIRAKKALREALNRD